MYVADFDAASVCDTIAASTTLRHLQVAKYLPTDILSDAVRRNTSITSLQLDILMDMEAMCDAVVARPNITSLCITASGCRPRNHVGGPALLRAMPQLQSLILWNVWLPMGFFADMFAMAGLVKNLQYLELMDVGPVPPNIEALYDVLRRANQGIRVHAFRGISDEAIHDFDAKYRAPHVRTVVRTRVLCQACRATSAGGRSEVVAWLCEHAPLWAVVAVIALL